MKDEKGQDMTPDQYLESILNKKGLNANNNEVRKAFCGYFKDRSLTTLPMPLKQSQMPNLKNTKFNKLKQGFQTNLDGICK